MGRRSARPNAIPRLRVRTLPSGKTYYYYDHGGTPRREEPLGCDYGLAIKRWAEIEHDNTRTPSVITFRYVANRYRAEVIPTKAARTQRDNAHELDWLLKFFDDPPCPLEAIEPQHVHQYMEWRGAPVRATREKALLSHLWNWARKKGYTALPNPCAGIRGKKAQRNVYVDDAMFLRVWEKAGQPLRDAMDLAYLTGQRVADVLKMDERDIRDGWLHVQQNKTGVRRRIEVAGELAALLARIAARKAGYVVHATRLVVGMNGQPLTYRALDRLFREAREAAGIATGAFQFRDLRAKAATDKADREGPASAQAQLGHGSVTTTEGYIRNRIGKRVTATK